LKVTIRQKYTGLTPSLAVVVTQAPDLSSWAGFGTADSGGPWMLGTDWRYKLDLPTATTALSAAGGTGAARILNSQTDVAAETLWRARVESVVDQRDTTDATEIANGLASAITEGLGLTEISIPIGRAPGIGTTIPLGAKVAVTLNGERIVDRIRQITTVIQKTSGEPTVRVSGIIGSPDAGVQTPTQKALAKMLRRVQNLERR
jgi:hypothetical protein